MAAGSRDRIDDEFAQLNRKRWQIAAIQFAEVGWIRNGIKKRIFCRCGHKFSFFCFTIVTKNTANLCLNLA